VAKKLNIEFIRSEFKKEGYILLTMTYNNAHQKLKCEHPNGTEYNVSWSNWKQGTRSSVCGGLNKLTVEFVRGEFRKKGCILLAKEYKDSGTKMSYVRRDGRKHSITWNAWNNAQKSSKRLQCGRRSKITIDQVRKEFAEKGATLLTTIYTNNRSKLDYICKRDHKTTTTLSGWRQNHKCKYCFGNAKHTIEFIRSEFVKVGYTLLSTVYNNRREKLKYRCKRGHTHYMCYARLKGGKKCPTCVIEENSGCGHHNWKGGISKEPYCQKWTKKFRKSIKKRDGYKCMNPYCDSKDPEDLTIHHIDYNKKNCRHQNLITACRSCNGKANYNREWHEFWYKAIMYMRYGSINNG
jgi:hypothetical protein